MHNRRRSTWHRCVWQYISLACFVLVQWSVRATALQPPAGQEGFVPIDQIPPTEQLPAAPLLIIAYAFVWIAAMFYVWTVWRRLNKVEAELRGLERRMPGQSQTR
jgi:CcmD family protein